MAAFQLINARSASLRRPLYHGATHTPTVGCACGIGWHLNPGLPLVGHLYHNLLLTAHLIRHTHGRYDISWIVAAW